VAHITVDLRPGERLVLGDLAVELQHKSGRLVRLRVTAPTCVPVRREASDSPAAPGDDGALRTKHATMTAEG